MFWGVIVLAPFVVAGDTLDAWAIRIVENGRGPLVFGTVVGLLVADVLIPVPSSIISVMAGALLGFASGSAAVWLGMTVGCVLGYGVGRSATGWARRAEAEAPSTLSLGSLAVSRAVPVAAEVSVLMAGSTGVPFRPFLAVTSLANLGVALVYAAAGSLAVQTSGFLMAFGAAVVMPAAGLWIHRRVRPGVAGA